MKTAAVAIKSRFLAFRDKLASIQADPWPVCMGYAFGVFLATTPLIGLKVLIAIPICYLFRWSKISAIIGVLHVNILTGPVFYGFAFMIGRTIIGTRLAFIPSELLSFHGFLEMVTGSLEVFLSLVAGGLIIGIPSSVGAFFLARAIVRKREPVSMSVVKRSYETPLFTLITGASSGLGKEFAMECARRGRNLLLVALPGGNLDLLCKQLEKEFGIIAHAFETDLTEKLAIQQLAERVLRDYRVNFLINNAGIGGAQAFETCPVDEIDHIILLNIRALSLLTRLMVHELKLHPQSFILNVSSIAAFSPIPFKTVYPASKAFVYSFSRSLSQELKGSSVRVSVVHPGPIPTHADAIRRIANHGALGKIGLLPASSIARISLDGIRRHKEVIVPGFMNKITVMSIRLCPSCIRLRFLSRVFRRDIQQQKSLAA